MVGMCMAPLLITLHRSQPVSALHWYKQSTMAMRDVHYVMSAALPFVNYISHIVKHVSGKTLNLTVIPCTNLY